MVGYGIHDDDDEDACFRFREEGYLSVFSPISVSLYAYVCWIDVGVHAEKEKIGVHTVCAFMHSLSKKLGI